ncbi:MAG: FAD synthase [Candidatus Methanomethylophilus sp.]|nr:FAD synthase [Methanomethylophilus sp.]
MVRVMASGVFDLIHPGHISYLKQARAYGDELIVVVACDDTVRKKKHEPITPDYMRAKIVENLKPVDKAIVGNSTGDIYEILKDVQPDVIVLGFDQKFDEGELEKSLAEHGFGNIKVKRATETADDLNATRRIVDKIRKMGGAQ